MKRTLSLILLFALLCTLLAACDDPAQTPTDTVSSAITATTVKETDTTVPSSDITTDTDSAGTVVSSATTEEMSEEELYRMLEELNETPETRRQEELRKERLERLKKRDQAIEDLKAWIRKNGTQQDGKTVVTDQDGNRLYSLYLNSKGELGASFRFVPTENQKNPGWGPSYIEIGLETSILYAQGSEGQSARGSYVYSIPDDQSATIDVSFSQFSCEDKYRPAFRSGISDGVIDLIIWFRSYLKTSVTGVDLSAIQY